jgi:hypothetical protein
LYCYLLHSIGWMSIYYKLCCNLIKKHFSSTNSENHNLDTRQRNNLYLPQTNLTIYQKAAYYLGIKIFNNLPLEIKNVAGNQKKFKIALKKFLYTYSFYTIEEYLGQLWIMYCITRFFIVLVLYFDLRFCLCTLCKYSWIVFKFLSWHIIYVLIDYIFWTDHISLCKLDLSYLCLIITNYYYYMYFIVETHSVLCLLLSIDKFYIHSGGYLE